MPISNQPVRASLGSVAAKPADAKDLAKDVAAMSLAGGVIVIGVDETAGTATAVNPFPLAGRVEQIQQVIDSRVQPPPSVTIDALPTAQGASDGVILITIMPGGAEGFTMALTCRASPTPDMKGAARSPLACSQRIREAPHASFSIRSRCRSCQSRSTSLGDSPLDSAARRLGSVHRRPAARARRLRRRHRRSLPR